MKKFLLEGCAPFLLMGMGFLGGFYACRVISLQEVEKKLGFCLQRELEQVTANTMCEKEFAQEKDALEECAQDLENARAPKSY